jgi:hypothetical protein
MLIVPSACPACIPASSGKANPIAISFSAAAKAAERKKRFDEARKKLKNSDPHPQEQSKNSLSNSLHNSPDNLSLSSILVNMLVGNTHFHGRRGWESKPLVQCRGLQNGWKPRNRMSGWSPCRDLDEKVAEAVGNWRFEPVVGPMVDKRVNLANRRNSERAFSGIRQ